MAKAKMRDLYMNIFPFSVTLADPADTFVEQKHATGMSIRGGLAWLVHLVEIAFLKGMSVTNHVAVTVSTVANLGAMPDVADKGTLVAGALDHVFTTSGRAFHVRPSAWHFLPPLPIATANISAYAQCESDEVALQLATINGRLGFTTVELDAALYTEIAETWGYGG